jgi:hypothetical protein
MRMRIRVTELKAGCKLSSDIMVQDSVLLRKGTLLSAAHIARIKRLGLTEVSIEAGVDVPVEADSAVLERVDDIPVPNFKTLTLAGQPSWMADESFNRPVPPPTHLSSREQFAAKHKTRLRAKAGLKPMLDPKREAQMTKSLHATFMTSAVNGRIDLDRLNSLADQLSAEIQQKAEDYISFLDIPQFGHYLASRSIMSSKVYSVAAADDSEAFSELLRGHLAMCNAFALLPAALSQLELTGNWNDQEEIRDALLAYYEWLRSQQRIAEQALEQLMLRFERHDGSGMPYGLKGDMIPPASQNWSLSWHYSGQVFSQPNTKRQTPHSAAEGMVRQSGRAFAGTRVNRFLRKIGYYPVGSLVELSNSSLGIVVKQNEDALFKPIVRIVDSEGNVGKVVDLTGESELFIVRQLMEH